VAGGPASWTITVSNAGPSTADGVVVTDQLPAALSNVAATTAAGSCTVAGVTLTCPIGTVAVGTPVAIVVGGTVDPAFRGTLTNTAAVASTTPDPDPSNATATATSTVGGVIDLTITKAVDRPEGLVGSTATYTIVAGNVGPSTAANVIVDEELPDGVAFAAARPGVGTFDAEADRWSIGSLPAGANVTLEIDVTLEAVGSRTNTVTIGQTATQTVTALTPTGDEETNVDNNTATATIEVTQPSDGLPVTGFSGWSVGGAAVAALGAGGALLLAARRRRPRRAA
jgi:uncharacterized repeat protein (TIGR01451 family)